MQVLGLVGRKLAPGRTLRMSCHGGLPLCSLNLSFMSITLTLLPNLLRHMPYVEGLKVCLTLQNTPHGTRHSKYVVFFFLVFNVHCKGLYSCRSEGL